MMMAIIDNITPFMSYRLNQKLFVDAAFAALRANPEMAKWTDKKSAMDEIHFKDEMEKRWYRRKHNRIIAAKMIEQRLLASPQVKEAIAKENLEADDKVDFIVHCRLIKQE